LTFVIAGNATASQPVVEELCQYVEGLPSFAMPGVVEAPEPETVANPPLVERARFGSFAPVSGRDARAPTF